MFLSNPIRAQEPQRPHAGDCIPGTLQTDVRPDREGPPTIVETGIRMADLREIDDIAQTISVDFAILQVWQDNRLSHLEGCRVDIASIWYPEFVLLNSGRTFQRWPERASIGPDGTVTYIQRISGTLSSYHNLHDFPFDEQRFTIRFFPLNYDTSEMALKVNEVFTGMSEVLNISDWKVEGVEGIISERQLLAFEEARAQFEFVIEASRIESFYVWKVILPLSLIVFMSWCVFWIDPAQYGSQIGLSATSMLTMIAFIFATTNILPALGYFTTLDVFIAGSTVLVFLSLIVSLSTSYLISIGSKNGARRLDKACRIVFPLVFLIFSAGVFSSAV